MDRRAFPPSRRRGREGLDSTPRGPSRRDKYVDGLQNALFAGAGLAVVAAVAAGVLIGRRGAAHELVLAGEGEFADAD